MIKLMLRPLPIAAISFDLDDTLYDNRPIMHNAEAQVLAFLAKQYPRVAPWTLADWLTIKKQVIGQFPSLAHDTSAARLASIEQGLLTAGYSKVESAMGAQSGLEHFLQHRSDFTVGRDVIQLLERLGQDYRLIGISNGNVDANKIGLGEVFEFVLHPSENCRMKPYPDMFHLACDRLKITSSQLLHIGDSYRADVQGARRANCQAGWLNPAVAATVQELGEQLLPHMQLSSVHELMQLVR